MTLHAILILLFTNLAILLALLTILWFVSTRIKDASIVDIAWGPACFLPALLTYAQTDGANPRAIILVALSALWALRLALYLAKRNLGHGEDYRYQRMRAAQGSDAAFARWSLPFVFWMQGLIAWFISLPVQLGQLGGQLGGQGFGAIAITGVFVFAVGLGFESIGDWQLRQFKSDPANKGKLMTKGLWSWTRHPNYFGDAAVWTGLTLIALESPYGIWTITSPAVMTLFLVKVSGKAMTERYMMKKYPEYVSYKERVSGFIPIPPKAGE